MKACIRLASEHDAAQISEIYAPIVEDTSFSFELTAPTTADMRQRIVQTLEWLPWLSCEVDGAVGGYCYANPHRVRAAYQWSVEVSVYVHAAFRQRGAARALYTSLFALLRLQGFYNAYAGIALPNDTGVRLHESLGFAPIGVYQGVAYKRGAWHDVGWWHLRLQDLAAEPQPALSLPSAMQAPGWEAALGAGARLLSPSQT